MELTKEEFQERFIEGQELLLKTMAESPEISIDRFYTMACILENIYFFTPVLYNLLEKNK